jgi:hypothetical protein
MVLGGDQLEYGPATWEEVSSWISEGRLNQDSLIRAVGKEWKRLGALPEFAEPLRSQAAAFGFGQSAETSQPRNVDLSRTQARETARPLDVWGCLRNSARLLRAHAGLIFGACFLVWMIGVITWFIPGAGLAYWILRGALFGGLYLVVLGAMRGQAAGVGDVFAPLRFGASHLILAGLVTSFLTWISLFFCALPGLYLFVAWTFALPLAADRRLPFWPAMELSRRVVTRQWFRVLALLLIAFFPFILISAVTEVRVTLQLAELLRESMTGKPMAFNEMLVSMSKIARANLDLMLATKFVFLVNMPFGICALMHAYEDLFGNRPTTPP